MELTDSVAERHVGPPTPGIEPVSLGGFFFFFLALVYNSLAGTDQTQVEKVADGLQKKM